MRWMILFLAVNLIGCAEQELPSFPDIEGCRIVWAEEPYCRCSRFSTREKTSYPKEECNFSLRPGDWSKIEDYMKALERKVKKSYKQPFNQFNKANEEFNNL